MSFRIPEEKISEIKNAADIVDIISEVVRLNKTGKNFVGLCPFHSEKTPSFTVSPDKQIFHCFGCGEGGNIFSFLMKQDNLSYPEAIKELAKRCNIDLPRQVFGADGQKQRDERERLLDINQQAAGYFYNVLLPRSTGNKALEYLKKRGITKTSIERFKLGYAPEGWRNLSDFFLKKKISPLLLEKTGLVVSKKGGTRLYDRFRNRIIFPICDINVQTIGFGGRALDDSLPKYLNSPETALYNKRRSLYGLHIAKKRCRESDTVYIVEGYFDCIMLHQHGLENTVATLGTALTPEHIRILKGYARKIILVFDSDEAGIKAAARSISLFIKESVDARIMVLPVDHDPDSFILAYGTEKFLILASKASGVITFLIDCAFKKHGFGVEGKIGIVSDLLEPLAAIEDPVARSLYVKEVSERIGIDEAPILTKVNEILRKKGHLDQISRNKELDPAKKALLQQNGTLDPRTRGIRLERRIIAMMLQFPEILADIDRYDVLDNFENDVLKSIGRIILKHKNPDGNLVSEILNSIHDDEKKRIIAKLGISDDLWARNGCIKLINQFLDISRARHEKKLIEQIKDAERRNDQELLLKLLIEKQKKAVHTEKQKITIIG